MPLNESTAKPRRARWPLEFDIEGIPRDTATRAKELEKRKLSMSRNSFLTDKNEADPLAGFTAEQKAALLDSLLKTAPVGKEIDLSKPIIRPYNPRDPKNAFPRMVYHHDSGHTLTVANEKQLNAAKKHGYKLEPSPDHDYSKLPNGYASVKAAAEPRPEDIFAEDLVDEEDEQEEQTA